MAEAIMGALPPSAKPREEAKRKSQVVEVLRRLADNRGAMVGGIILMVVFVLAAIAPWIIPYDYEAMDISSKFLGPSLKHLFGTDQLGRDVFSRLLYGARYSLSIGIGAVALSSCCGILLGSIAGFFGAAIDEVIMRVCDVIQSIPGMILNIALSCMLGPGVFNTILALGIGGIAGTARLMRASILNVRKMEYLDAATSTNCSSLRIIIKHVLPNSFAPLIVQATMGVGARIIDAAGLSYIGIGVQPPIPEWGAMLVAGRDYIKDYAYLTIIPGLAIIVVVLALNLLGDGLRDALDPKLKK